MLSFRSIGRSYLRGPTVSSSFQHPLRRGLNGLIIGVPKENHALGEHRVALVPGNVTKLSKAGAKVIVEQDAGVLSGYSNEQVQCFLNFPGTSLKMFYTQVHSRWSHRVC